MGAQRGRTRKSDSSSHPLSPSVTKHKLKPSYTRLDAQVSRQLGEGLEFSLVGQNLLGDHHLESDDMLTSVTPTQMKRSAYAKITWRFW
jgi:outer membrane receptor protein involved in Fe transport